MAGTFAFREEDPKQLVERVLSRPARLELEWTDEEGRKTRVYLPDDGRTQLWIDQIVMQEDRGVWRRVKYVDTPTRR